MRPGSVTRDLLDRVRRHPDRFEHLTLESGASLPVLVGHAERPALAVFWFPVGGPIDDRRIYPPYFETVVPLDAPDRIAFRPLDASRLGLRPGPDGSLGPDVGGALTTQADIDAVLAALHASLDALAACYARPSGALTDAERAAARTYRGAFGQLAEPALVPAYRRFSPAFFTWLDAAV